MDSSVPSSSTVLDALDHHWSANTPVTASEVTEEFDCPQRTIHRKLESLVDDGVLNTKEIEGDSRVWWRSVERGQEPREASYEGRAQVRSHPVFDSEMVGVIVWDADGTVEDANDAFLEMVGLDYDEALGTSWRDLSPEEFYRAGERHLREVEESGSGVPYEKQYYHADRSRWWGLFESRRLNEAMKVEFVIDITERREYERALERRNVQLERLNKFTDALSHDLRSPLSVIGGRLHLYRETGEPEHLDAIGTTAERMEQLVEDLLQVARSGQVVKDPDSTLIGDVLETAREGSLPESATCEYEPVRPLIADSDRLVQVFENLLQNSVDHGGEGGTVRVGPLENGFYVEDDGPGVPEADRERLFKHGYTTREDGVGYGLSIVRSIVDGHGWDIVVTEAEDGGARFEVTGVDFVNDR
jgi:PAS domain S-box-containing protein